MDKPNQIVMTREQCGIGGLKEEVETRIHRLLDEAETAGVVFQDTTRQEIMAFFYGLMIASEGLGASPSYWERLVAASIAAPLLQLQDGKAEFDTSAVDSEFHQRIDAWHKENPIVPESLKRPGYHGPGGQDLQASLEQLARDLGIDPSELQG